MASPSSSSTVASGPGWRGCWMPTRHLRPTARGADPAQAACPVGRALPDLPDPRGVAGAVAGLSGDALIVAGGANFPNGFPWEGGKKAWHAEAYVRPKGARNWIVGPQLPYPLAYAVSLTASKARWLPVLSPIPR